MEHLDVRLLGTFVVAVDGVALPPAAWSQRRAADLVKLLALAPAHRVVRDLVLDALWPHLEPRASAASLHKAAHYARRTIGSREAVVLAGGSVALAPGARVTTDVAAFETDPGARYPGDLLPDDLYEAWTREPRDRLRALALDRLRAARRWAEVAGLDPADEEAQRQLMRAAARAGDRAGVVRRYEQVRGVLAALGTQPSAETVRLVRELSRGPAVDAPLGEEVPMSGRSGELATALDRLAAADRGAGGVVVLAGGPRSGKTRLAEAVLLAARERRWHTLRASAEEHAEPLQAATEALAAARPDLAGRGVAPLVRAARERGCAVLLDDLHAGGDAIARVLGPLAEQAATERLLILACWQPSEARAALRAALAGVEGRRLTTTVRLAPLDDDVRAHTRYATAADGARIAYQVVGEGACDLVVVPGFVSNVERLWDLPAARRMFTRLARGRRLVLWDKRGTGLSDPVAAVPSLEERMLDLTAVLDASGVQRPVLFGVSEGGPMSLLFAARHPQRVAALVLYGTAARFMADAEHPRGWRPGTARRMTDDLYEHWGTGALLDVFSPSRSSDPINRELFGRIQRAGASPAMGRAMVEAMFTIDVREVLAAITAPTLVVHRSRDRLIDASGGRMIAAGVRGATYVELPGEDHFPFLVDMDDVVEEIEAFMADRPWTVAPTAHRAPATSRPARQR